MKILTILKSGVGLVYTTILIAAVWFGAIWLTQFVIKLSWTGAIIFWLIGLPIMIGLFQFLATLMAMPTVYLIKGSKWLSWLLLLPVVYFIFSFGRFLWLIAANVGGALIWLLMISWFAEIAWVFVAYLMVSIGSAYEEQPKNEIAF